YLKGYQMKIVFISNFFNHHQKYLSDNFYRITGGNYRFVATEEMPSERTKLGYKSFDDVSYVINAIESKKSRNAAIKFIESADVVIVGSFNQDVISPELFYKKLHFIYSERPLKKGNSLIKYPVRYCRWHFTDKIFKNAYILCASAFTYSDYSKFNMFKNRAYKWGYFPETKKYDIDELMHYKEKSSILWCGRLIDWKHPDDAVKTAKKLKDDGCNFELNIIGNGNMFDILSDMIKEYSLDDCVHLLGAKPSNEVRQYMEKASLYLFTSDKYEGWGAVLNEAMNSGCAVIASHIIGAVPYMLNDGENGYVYHSGNVEELYEKVKQLLDDKDEQNRIGKNAYYTVVNEWNPENAAGQLVNLAQQLLNNEKIVDLIENGPCSRADIIPDNWF
ncbi:MAG: glycosyltransferase, partial [Erysipelotrichia bacterium]|nr:glycosyltransferase [Erysipelotrichia bacterium]